MMGAILLLLSIRPTPAAGQGHEEHSLCHFPTGRQQAKATKVATGSERGIGRGEDLDHQPGSKPTTPACHCVQSRPRHSKREAGSLPFNTGSLPDNMESPGRQWRKIPLTTIIQFPFCLFLIPPFPVSLQVIPESEMK